MKIPLSQGKFAIVGPRDYTYLMQWKWYCSNGYAVRNRPGGGNGLIYMHRVILERMGFKDFEDSDHINRSKTDNRRLNLRPVTHRQNLCNRSKQRNSTSGYAGVNWCKRDKRWLARIYSNGKCKCLGYFNDKEEARQARDVAVRKYYGKFAVLNKE